MSDLPFDDYVTELSQLAVTEDPPFYNGSCLGCLANEPDQLSHMGLGGCLADDYDYYNNTAPLEPLSDEQLAELYDSVVPEDVQFSINGHLVPPGTAVMDALSAIDNHGDYCDEDDECYGCQMDSMSRADHTGVNGCLTDMGGCC
jgi:hypothetical protein